MRSALTTTGSAGTTALILLAIAFSASVMLNGCDLAQACPYSSGSASSGAIVRFTPSVASMPLGQSLRLDFTVPYNLPETNDSMRFDASTLNDFASLISFHNQRGGFFSGAEDVTIGAMGAVLDSTDRQALIYFVKGDTSARLSVVLHPADTGLYFVHFRPVSAGAPCSFDLTDVSFPDGRHTELAYPDGLNSSDSDLYSHNYYFRVY